MAASLILHRYDTEDSEEFVVKDRKACSSCLHFEQHLKVHFLLEYPESLNNAIPTEFLIEVMQLQVYGRFIAFYVR